MKPRKVFVNPIYKDRARVLKTSEDTNGEYLLGELEVAPGGGNFPHIHTAFEETFLAVKGTLGVWLKGTKFYLQPGESMTIPLRTPHYFFNDGKETILCHIRFDPPHEDFVKGIAIGYGLAADGKTTKKGTPKKLIHLALLISLTDTRAVGVMGWLMPLFKWLAKRAKKSGLEQQLLEKYYYEFPEAGSITTFLQTDIQARAILGGKS